MREKDIDVLVIGSLNMDIVIESERHPLPGETILGSGFFTTPGGKGANQAVALSRLGMKVSMMGCVGRDDYGAGIIQNLRNNGVDVSAVRELDGVHTGCAVINVYDGQNSIVVYRGANDLCREENLPGMAEYISRAKILLMQLEIPIETMKLAASLAKECGTKFVLNPAPAMSIGCEDVVHADLLIPNELEAKTMLGVDYESELSYPEMIDRFWRQGYKSKMVITLGKEGVAYKSGEEAKLRPAYNVKAVDSTGAGDAFIAGYCFGLLHYENDEDIISFASAVAAISVTKLGAQAGLPTLAETEEFLTNNKPLA